MQNSTESAPRTISLRAATYSFVLIGLVIAAVGTLSFANNLRVAYQAAALDLAVRTRLQGAAADLSRGLQEDWERLAKVSQSDESTEIVGSILDAAFGNDRQVAWVGIMDASDEPIRDLSPAAPNGNEQGWLAAARNGPFLGIAPSPVSSEEALVMARPMARGGVVVAVIPFSRLTDYLKISANALAIDLLLTGAGGSVIASSDGFDVGTQDIPSLRSAAAGTGTSQIEIWPDGISYFSSVLPLHLSADIPTPGLKIIGRIDPIEFAAAERLLKNGSLRLIVTLLAAIGALSVLYVKVFIAPFSELAQNADRIAHGSKEYPYDGRQTTELAMLSSALVRLRSNRPISRIV